MYEFILKCITENKDKVDTRSKMKEDELEAAYNTFLMVMDNGQLIDTMLTTGSVKSTTASQKDALLAPQTVIIT